MGVTQTSCRFCGQDIEAFSPYRKGTWHDRGGNATCPTKAGDRDGLKHAPYVDRMNLQICSNCAGPIDARTINAGGEVCFACASEG